MTLMHVIVGETEDNCSFVCGVFTNFEMAQKLMEDKSIADVDEDGADYYYIVSVPINEWGKWEEFDNGEVI